MSGQSEVERRLSKKSLYSVYFCRIKYPDKIYSLNTAPPMNALSTEGVQPIGLVRIWLRKSDLSHLVSAALTPI